MIPEGVTEIGWKALCGCESPATDLTIPRGVTRIGDSVLSSCRSPIEVQIPDGMTEIVVWASGCCRSPPGFGRYRTRDCGVDPVGGPLTL
jgi:hypothetical protein